MFRSLASFVVATLGLAASARAHDTWVQVNTPLIRPNDAVYIDLLLGNHGNDHRDFKQASKIRLEQASLDVVLPDGTKLDLKPQAIDTGYTPNEGHWSAKFVPTAPGLYVVDHAIDSKYLTTRSLKSSKTFFVASASLDKVPHGTTGFDRTFGHPLELVMESNPVAPMGPGQALKVRLLYRGKPLEKTKISFIPRGATLKEGFDETYERTTDADGRTSFTPTEGNYYLIAAHREEPEEKGDGYDKTKYSATIAILVPQTCPCCE
jgi:uncharacterized GH25 family protein